MKRMIKDRLKNFFHWIGRECRDRKTVLLLFCVIVVVYFPVWGGYLLHALFGWAWCSAVASACLLFWAGPFTPFFPICIGITLSLKKAATIAKRKRKEGSCEKEAPSEATHATPRAAKGKNASAAEKKGRYIRQTDRILFFGKFFRGCAQRPVPLFASHYRQRPNSPPGRPRRIACTGLFTAFPFDRTRLSVVRRRKKRYGSEATPRLEKILMRKAGRQSAGAAVLQSAGFPKTHKFFLPLTSPHKSLESSQK